MDVRRAALADDGAMLRRSRTEPEAVHETDLGGRRQRGERLAQAGEVRLVEPVRVDLSRAEDSHGDARRTRHDGAEELRALVGRDLLRVVQPGQRPDSM